MFGDKDASGIVLLKSYEDYLNGYDDEKAVLYVEISRDGDDVRDALISFTLLGNPEAIEDENGNKSIGIDANDKDAIAKFMETKDNTIANGPATDALVKELEACGCDASKEILEQKDYLAKKSVWIFIYFLHKLSLCNFIC